MQPTPQSAPKSASEKWAIVKNICERAVEGTGESKAMSIADKVKEFEHYLQALSTSELRSYVAVELLHAAVKMGSLA
jgi:hypothetical protein